MRIHGEHYHTIWSESSAHGVVHIIDQRRLPWHFEIIDLRSVNDTAHAIKDMAVRGAGCIGVTAAFGMYLAAIEAASGQTTLQDAAEKLIATRPTAADLAWAVRLMLDCMLTSDDPRERIQIAFDKANAIASSSISDCAAIGQHGLSVIQQIASRKPGQTINILTHCNAGWLAFVDHGSATAPIYAAQAAGIPIHVWVDETRPRNQGARLTAFELAQQGIPHTVIADNAGGHLMQHGQVDLVITGADRVTANGDAANKIGTYLKALAAKDNEVPFYIAFPESTFDPSMKDGIKEIPIEERSAREVTHVDGLDDDGVLREIRIIPEPSVAANPAFDVTPARLITGFITPKGVFAATELQRGLGT